uniref:Target of Nesh-SH3-like n=1 Tax=Takifugu rubripes TaxID=31033 RepID=H2UR23_TAKRU
VLSSCNQQMRHHNIKVRINATGDTIVLKFLLPNAHTKLEGYILGYGSRLFSKQFIQLPENGLSFVKEFDAEPKYLIAVKPIQINEVKKYCTGKVELEKPLHLVVGPVTPSSVLLSWGDELKSSYEGNILKECLEQGHYTVRYREKSKRWNYQTCPTSDTVIDNLKPNAVYEFGVKPISKEGTGEWSKPVVHNTSNVGLTEHHHNQPQETPQSIPDSQHPQHTNEDKRKQGHKTTIPMETKPPKRPKTITQAKPLDQPLTHQPPIIHHQPEGHQESKPILTFHTKPQTQPVHIPHTEPLATFPFPMPFTALPQTHNQNKHLPKIDPHPKLEPTYQTIHQTKPQVKPQPTLQHQSEMRLQPTNQLPADPVRTIDPRLKFQPTIKTFQSHNAIPEQPQQQPTANLLHHTSQQTQTSHPKYPIDSQDGDSCQIQLMNPTNHSSSYLFPLTVTNYDSENSTGFSPSPASKVDSAGNKRFTAPHVIYKTNKKPEEPCSITSSLTHFPDEEANDLNVTSPPRIPPSNLTVVTVEGCPSFVILDWQKSDNETTVYQVVSTTEGPSGNVTSIVTTNQTHTAVENLKPESNYTFTVTPKNELGTGPPTDPVAFSTEAADPRVSEYVSGKNSIWSAFPFQSTSDAYSECHGRMFVKRTWYRKFVGIQLCNSLRYQIYLSDSLNGKFYNIGDLTGSGEDHCQFVDSFLDGNTGAQIPLNELPKRPGFYRAMRHEPVSFGEVGGNSRATYVGWYECGTPIPGKW